MADTLKRAVRVDPAQESAARRAHPELESVDFSTLVRVGLAVLAAGGVGISQAIHAARLRPGPKGPRTGGTR